MHVVFSAWPLELPSFLKEVVRAMSENDFVLLPLKALLMGAVFALVCCAVPLGAPGLSSMPARFVPRVSPISCSLS